MITSHPQNVEILQGHKGILEVEAHGTMPLYYQWYYENNIMHGIYYDAVYLYLLLTTL